MKILFITGSLNQGGAEYQILELAKLFKQEGHSIEIFALTNYDYYKGFVEKNELQYAHLSNDQSRFKRIILTIGKVRKFKPDLIISYLRSVSQVALAAKLLSFTNTKLIVGERTSLVLPRYDMYYFNLMKLADCLTVNSISKLEYIKRRFPSYERKVQFFPNIIDLHKFNFIGSAPKTDVINLGFVGRISPEKNVLNLVLAIKILIDQGIKIQLKIYGDARNKEYYEKVQFAISENSLDEVVHVYGKANNMIEIYKKIDALCLISDYEGFSNVLSEALSCGIPIITSEIPENMYLVEDRVNGFVVDQKSVKSIANGIKNYYNLSKEHKEKMTIINRRKAEKIFDNKAIYREYMNLINSL